MRSANFFSLAAAGLSATLPVALAALGGLYTELAGSLSVALEGAILAGAFAAILAFKASASLALALAAALLAGLASGWLLGAASTRLKADVFVAGLAVNLLVPPLLAILSEGLFGTKGVVPLDADSARAALGDGTEVAFLILLAIALLWAALELTPLGMRLRAAGEKGEALRAAGLDRDGMRRLAHAVAGAASGLAGAFLALSVAAFVPGIAAGRGWMALVAIYLGARRPGFILLASGALGILLALADAAQSLPWFPVGLLSALPYVATLLIYVVSRALARGR